MRKIMQKRVMNHTKNYKKLCKEVSEQMKYYSNGPLINELNLLYQQFLTKIRKRIKNNLNTDIKDRRFLTFIEYVQNTPFAISI
jgi:hypothetical protein